MQVLVFRSPPDGLNIFVIFSLAHLFFGQPCEHTLNPSILNANLALVRNKQPFWKAVPFAESPSPPQNLTLKNESSPTTHAKAALFSQTYSAPLETNVKGEGDRGVKVIEGDRRQSLRFSKMAVYFADTGPV